jgi:cytochrome c-type biogenesis protein CcmE
MLRTYCSPKEGPIAMTTGRKLAIGGVIIAGVTAYLAYRGASATWQYYLTAEECLAERASLAGQRVRVSGRIAAGSFEKSADQPPTCRFALEGPEGNPSGLKVVCSGPLPDNLAEGMAVLVEGRVDDAGVVRGDKVLTRCASKYQSSSSVAPVVVADKGKREGNL